MTDHPLLLLLAVGSLLYLSSFLHEVGHCLVGRVMGYTPTSLGMGTGRPFLVFTCKGTRVYFGRTRPMQGLIFLVHPGILPSRYAGAWTMAGGILAHIVQAAVFFGLSRLAPSGNWLWLPGMCLNLLMAWINLIPLSVRIGNAVIRSDGAQILMHLRDGLVETPPAMRTQTVEVLHPLWTQIGDALGLYGHLMAAAVAWSELLDTRRALQCYEEARVLPVEHTPFVESYNSIIGALVHRSAGRVEEARTAYEQAVAGLHIQGHAAGLFLMELAEGEQLLLEGKTGEAVQALDRMDSHPEIRQRTLMRASLLATRLSAHLEAGTGESETLLKEWEGARRRYPSPSRDRKVLTALARARRRQGRLEEAAVATERLLQALQEMHRGLVGLAGAADFAANHETIVTEARETLVEANRDASLADPAVLFPTSEQLVQQVTDEAEAANRRRHRIGFWWSVANVCLAPVILAIAISYWQPAPGVRPSGAVYSAVFLGLALGLVGLMALAYGLYLQIACRWWPGLRTNGGRTTLVLAVMPWVMWLMTAALFKR